MIEKNQSEDSKIVDLYRASQLDLFRMIGNESISPLEFATAYCLKRAEVIYTYRSSKEGLRTKLDPNYIQYEVVAFLGLDGNNPTHEQLKNAKAFFGILGYFLRTDQFPSLYLSDVTKAIEFHKSSCPDLVERSHWFYTLNCLASVFSDYFRTFQAFIPKYSHLENRFAAFKQFVEDFFCDEVISNARSQLSKACIRLQQSFISNRKIRIYRGFSVDAELSIRPNRMISKNHNERLQVGGKGCSFSLSREKAERFATHPIKKIEEFGDYATRIHCSEVIHRCSASAIRAIPQETKLTCYVGTYEVDLEDVILNLSAQAEQEVIAHPDQARLLRYDPVRYS